MTVSRRLRFEILRRDNHSCKYCGSTADDGPLTIDHVVPITLGGKDVPENLVAACVACNAGKSSIQPDGPLVADVSMRAAAWSMAIRQVVEIRAQRRDTIEAALDYFDEVWLSYTYTDAHGEAHTIDRASDWMFTFESWITRGITAEELTRHIPLAMRDRVGGSTKRRLAHEDRWSYFCGIAWNLVAEFETEVQTLADATYEADSEAAGDPFYGLDDDIVAWAVGDQLLQVFFGGEDE